MRKKPRETPEGNDVTPMIDSDVTVTDRDVTN